MSDDLRSAWTGYRAVVLKPETPPEEIDMARTCFAAGWYAATIRLAAIAEASGPAAAGRAADQYQAQGRAALGRESERIRRDEDAAAAREEAERIGRGRDLATIREALARIRRGSTP